MTATFSRLLLVSIVLATVSLVIPTAVWAQVTVTLADGKRVFADRILPESSKTHLSLEIKRPGVVLVRKLPLEQIRQVKIRKRQFRAYKVNSVSTVPVATIPHQDPQPRLPKRDSVEQIRTILVDAHPVSSHGRVDWDALAINLRAFDQFGHLVPTQGTIRITLWGRSQELIRSYGREYFSNPRQIKKLATWTSQAHKSAPIVLPLPTPLPDHNPRVFPVGELHVQLLVPGQGTFEAIQRNVMLKHLGPLRDQLMTESGSRFFPKEGTYGRRHPSGLKFRETSSFRPESAIFTVQP